MQKRRKLFAGYLLLIACGLIVYSCGSGGENNIVTENEVYLLKDDIKGTWLIDNQDLFFFRFDEYGQYTFCFDKTMMGAGNYTLNQNIIVLHNEFTNTYDSLSVNLTSKLTLVGEIKKFKSQEKIRINLFLDKFSDDPFESIIGSHWETRHKYTNIYTGPKDVMENIDIISKYLLTYTVRNYSGLKDLVEQKNMFYIYNNGLTYTQSTSSDKVTIYNIPYTYHFNLGSLADLEVK